MPESALENVTARIPPAHKTELRARAGDQGLSGYLADLIRDHIEGGENQVLLDSVSVLQEELAEQRRDVAALRSDIATVLEALLLNMTKVSPEEVQRFVSVNLRRAGEAGGGG